MMRPRVILLGLFCLLALPVQAATTLDGNRLQLESGQIVRLASLLAPTGDQPEAAAATAYLQQLVEGQSFSAPTATPAPNGEIVTDLPLGKSTVATQMISAGWARAYPTLGDATDLLPLEAAARAAKRGIWADFHYRIRPPDEAHYLLNSYGLIEGRVSGTGQAKGRFFLNFGPDWKTDFTIELDKSVAKQIDWQVLTGQLVRGRGWVDWNYGPHILVTQPAQLELAP